MSTQAMVFSAVERANRLLGGGTAIKEVLDGVEQLNSDLSRLADTLLDADKEMHNELDRQVRELVYDLEDSIERYALRQGVGTSPSASRWTYSRCLVKYRSIETSFLEDLQVLGSKAKNLTDRVGYVRSSRREWDNVSFDRRETNSESVLIGLGDYQEHLAADLLEGGSGLSEIAIIGMGGIGKTTLAQWAYSHAPMVQSFDCRAWATVGQDYRPRHLLLTILSSLSPETNKSKIAAMDNMELTQMLYNSLKGKRYFLCLDDVWSEEALGSLRFVFPDDRKGSRILITTRDMRIAGISDIKIKMWLLNVEESWALFRIKSGLRFNSDTSNPRTEETIGKAIVGACRGLPLAITLMGQLLSRMSLENWELILQALRLGNEDSWELGSPRFLDLSYETLPFRLKACFLYMGCFPPDQPIIVDKLHLLWMAEGLISSIEEAREYSNELIFRGLLTVVEKEDMLASTKFISGRMHDLIRDLCIFKGRHEKLFKVIDFSYENETSSYTYRLAVNLHQFEYANDVVLNIPDAKRIRSILFFDTVEPMPQSTWPSEFVDLTNFKSVSFGLWWS